MTAGGKPFCSLRPSVFSYSPLRPSVFSEEWDFGEMPLSAWNFFWLETDELLSQESTTFGTYPEKCLYFKLWISEEAVDIYRGQINWFYKSNSRLIDMDSTWSLGGQQVWEKGNPVLKSSCLFWASCYNQKAPSPSVKCSFKTLRAGCGDSNLCNFRWGWDGNFEDSLDNLWRSQSQNKQTKKDSSGFWQRVYPACIRHEIQAPVMGCDSLGVVPFMNKACIPVQISRPGAELGHWPEGKHSLF